MVETLSLRQIAAMGRVPGALDDHVGVDHPVLAIDLDERGDFGVEDVASAAKALVGFPVVIVGVGSPVAGRGGFGQLADVVVGADDPAFARIEVAVRSHPRASISLAMLLRGAAHRTTDEGLAAESAVYSMLQAGPEFAAWRRDNAVERHDEGEGPTVRIERQGDTLHISLARPHLHNAFNAQMRDELSEALAVAVSDPAVQVVLDGQGPSFCSGGDLNEFGSRSDPATAHLVRLERSVGRLIDSIADRVQAVVHGACLGSGVELPAFASRVVARADAHFALPEIRLGLIPGAGGTVSLTRRIGRQRTAYLALSGDEIDAPTALGWGLVDALIGDTASGGGATGGS
jgi:enoyl-CoA hydratase/carnithine racemase